MSGQSNKTSAAQTRRRVLQRAMLHFSVRSLGKLICNMLLALTVACGTAVTATAKDNLFAGAQTLELEQLIELVQARNADLEAARAGAEEAATRIKSAGALEDPMLSYKLAPATIGSREIGTRQGVEVSQTLPWPGTLHAREAKAKAEAEAAQNDTSMRTLEVVSDAKAAFAEWVFIYAALKINRQHQIHLGDLEAAAERSYATGVGRQQDALKASLELARVENEALGLESQRRMVQARINALLNRAPVAELPEPTPFRLLTRLPPLDHLGTMAMARHPELKGLEATLDSTEAVVALARKAFYPDLSVQAGYDEMWDAKEMRPSVGISFNVPLHWERREAELASARAAQRRAEWKVADRRATLLAAVAEAYASVDQAARSIALYKERLLPLADAAVLAALADYRLGTGGFSSVIDAERSKLDQQLSLERAIADQYRSLAALEQAIGGPLVEADSEVGSPASNGAIDHREYRP